MAQNEDGLIEQLRAMQENLHPMFANYRKVVQEAADQIEQAAAFLDVLAHHMTRWPAVGNHLKEQQNAAADCRAMAKKLRE